MDPGLLQIAAHGVERLEPDGWDSVFPGEDTASTELTGRAVSGAGIPLDA